MILTVTTSADLESLARDHERLVAFSRELRTTLVQAKRDARQFLQTHPSAPVLRGIVALMEIETAKWRKLFVACKRIREGRESEPSPKRVCHPRVMDEEPRRAIKRILGEWSDVAADLDALVAISAGQVQKAASEQAA